MAESFCSDGVRKVCILSEQNLISAVAPYISSPNNSPSSRFFLKMKETFWALVLFSLLPFKRDLGRPETANPTVKRLSAVAKAHSILLCFKLSSANKFMLNISIINGMEIIFSRTEPFNDFSELLLLAKSKSSSCRVPFRHFSKKSFGDNLVCTPIRWR